MTISRRSTIKTIGVVGAGSALSGTVLGVNEHEDDERDPEEDAPAEDEEAGALRVAHFSPDAPNVDVYVNDQRILEDVAYSDVSPYLEIVPGTYSLTITAAGDPEEIVLQQQFAVETGYYTAAAVGELEAEGEDDVLDDADEDELGDEGDADADAAADDDLDDTDEDLDDEDEGLETGTFEVLFFVDRTSEEVVERVGGEEAGQVRVVHASPDAPGVDLYVGDTATALFEDLEFTIPSGYFGVEEGSITFDLFPAGEGPEPDQDPALDPEGEADDEETIDPDEEAEDEDEDVIEEADPVFSFDVDVEGAQAYTAYIIGYLEADEELDDDDDLTDDEDDLEHEDDQLEDDDQDLDDDEDLADDEDDRSLEAVVLDDATTENDDDVEDDADYDAEDEVDEEPMEDDPETEDEYADDTDDEYADEDEYADDDYDDHDDDADDGY